MESSSHGRGRLSLIREAKPQGKNGGSDKSRIFVTKNILKKKVLGKKRQWRDGRRLTRLSGRRRKPNPLTNPQT